MNLTDTNKTIILPNYYFGNYGQLMALKSNTTRAGYIKFQVRFVYSMKLALHISCRNTALEHKLLKKNINPIETADPNSM